MSTTPEHRRARRLGATMQIRTVRPADGGLLPDGAELAFGPYELGIGPNELEAITGGTAEVIVETWQKIATRHATPELPEDPPSTGGTLEDQILQALGVEPMPASDLAERLGIDDEAVRGRLQTLRDAGLVATAGNRGWRLA